MKSGGIRRLGVERSCDRCSGGTWTDSNGINRRCSYCRGTGRVKATYVDGSTDDLTEALDTVADALAAPGYDPPDAAA